MNLADALDRLLPGRRPPGRFRASWNGSVLAESDTTVLLEGNRYFPPGSVRREHLAFSVRTYRCPWKGVASYHSIVAGGQRSEDAAWTYRTPSPPARKIKDHVAFGGGVTIERV